VLKPFRASSPSKPLSPPPPPQLLLLLLLLLTFVAEAGAW